MLDEEAAPVHGALKERLDLWFDLTVRLGDASEHADAARALPRRTMEGHLTYPAPLMGLKREGVISGASRLRSTSFKRQTRTDAGAPIFRPSITGFDNGAADESGAAGIRLPLRRKHFGVGTPSLFLLGFFRLLWRGRLCLLGFLRHALLQLV